MSRLEIKDRNVIILEPTNPIPTKKGESTLDVKLSVSKDKEEVWVVKRITIEYVILKVKRRGRRK